MTTVQKPSGTSAPLADAIAFAVSKLVDDAKVESRDPSHSEIESQINRAKLAEGDPRQTDNPHAGKAKRVRGVLSWALENNPQGGSNSLPHL